jgi:hypothetical protein
VEVLIINLKKEHVVEANKKVKNILFVVYAIILTLLGNSPAYAQNIIAAKSFVKDNYVYLRYVANNSNTFNDCKEKGFLIKRIKWEQSILPDSSNFKSSNSLFSIKPYGKDEKSWIDLIQKTQEAGFLYNTLFQTIESKTTDPNMAYGLAMLSCDFDIELSKAAGLFYLDENLPQGKYAYLIQPADAKLNKSIKPAIIIVNTAIDDRLRTIDSLKIETRKKEVKLVWDISQLKLDYTGYFIERSEDGKNFTQLNKKPHIQIQTQYEKEKKDISFNDTITEFRKTYYYRVRGLGFFGVSGNYSNVVKCRLAKPLDAYPLADKVNVVGDSTLEINWHMPKNFNLNEIDGFDILRSSTIEGVYSKINKKTLSKETTKFVDLKPKQSNYYKVLTFNSGGDSVYSHPVMGLVPDKTPPKVPVGLKGKVDTTGIVTLTWKANKEKDLKGYRVFRNNSMDEELVEITKLIFNDTVYKDTITLETLTEEVYYSITAVDQVYNNSPYTPAVKLKRPDKIKPVIAQFVSVTHTDTVITVKWINSTSKDVERYELWRSIQNKTFEKIKEWNATDSLTSFMDVHLEYASYYQYQLNVIDDDKNSATSYSATHYFDARIRKPITAISYKVNLEKRSITLNWEYPEKELYNFVIYKAKRGEPLKIVKTLKGNIFSFEDSELYIGNDYEYRIKANFNSGSESYISDAITITF